jgi:hypothetical protein
MPTTDPVVQRYRRTDQDRGEWLPVGSRWKTAASAGLVSHDIYHHLPDDAGTFAEEVATLGAEWYIDMQPIGKPFQAVAERDLRNLERNTVDTVLNALDSKEAQPFLLPSTDAPLLNDQEMALFRSLASKVLTMLEESADARAAQREDFSNRFVQTVLWGYAAAKARFPDQTAVRNGSMALRERLAYLDRNDVPYGHEVTVTLEGYRCTVTYTDADGPFLASNQVIEAVMMPWCTYEPGYPMKELSLHTSASVYVDYVAEHFRQQDDFGTPEELCLMPQDESSGLRKVYIKDPALQQALQTDGSAKLPAAALQSVDYTPRDVPVF